MIASPMSDLEDFDNFLQRVASDGDSSSWGKFILTLA